MAKISWKGSTLLGPIPPAIITCGSMEAPNLLTIAWTGIINTHPPMTYISIRPERFSYPLIMQSGEFAINLPTVSLLQAVDFCGVRSGRDLDKFAACSLHPEAASQISAPLLQESPLSLECRVTQKIELGTHHMLLAEIVAVSVDPALLNKGGKLCLDKAELLAFAHGNYYALGKQLGSFGYTVKKGGTPDKAVSWEQPSKPVEASKAENIDSSAQLEQPAQWDKPAQTGKSGKWNKSGKSGKSARSDQPAQSGKSGQWDKSARSDKPAQSGKSGQWDKSARSDKPAQSGKSGQWDKSARSDKPAQSGKSGQWDKSARSDKPAQSSKSGQWDKSARSDKPAQSGKSGQWDKSAKSAKPARPNAANKAKKPKTSGYPTKPKSNQ